MDKKKTILLATLAVVSAVTVGAVIHEVIKSSNSCSSCVSSDTIGLDENFKNNISTVNNAMGKCIFDISKDSSEYVESSEIPFEITLLKILNEKIKPISKFNKQLEYAQAVVIFRGWMCGVYLPMHYNKIDTALNEKGLKHSDENRLNEAIEDLKKSDCSELEVYGYKIDDLAVGLKKMIELGYSVERFFGVIDLNNDYKISDVATIERFFGVIGVNKKYKISDFAISDHDFGTLFATEFGKGWIFVCAVKAVERAYPIFLSASAEG